MQNDYLLQTTCYNVNFLSSFINIKANITRLLVNNESYFCAILDIENNIHQIFCKSENKC